MTSNINLRDYINHTDYIKTEQSVLDFANYVFANVHWKDGFTGSPKDLLERIQKVESTLSTHAFPFIKTSKSKVSIHFILENLCSPFFNLETFQAVLKRYFGYSQLEKIKNNLEIQQFRHILKDFEGPDGWRSPKVEAAKASAAYLGVTGDDFNITPDILAKLQAELNENSEPNFS